MKPVTKRETIFYDGECGLCHGFVLFVVNRDGAAHFDFAPLFGDYFLSRVPPERRAGIPDSVVVLSRDGELLVRSAGVLHVLRRLGGAWKLMASVASAFPAGVRDASYDWVARARKRLFAKPPDVCPVVPHELRSRFHA